MMWVVLCLLGMLQLALPWLSHAGDFLCGDTTSLERYIHAVDPSLVSQGNCTKPFSVVPADQTDSQYLLYTTTPFVYLKVVGTAPNGVLTLMTQGEQDAVNAASTALAAARQAFANEVTGNALCSATDLATVNSVLQARHDTLQTSIDGISTNTAAVIKAALSTVNDELLVREKLIARCLRALRVVR